MAYTEETYTTIDGDEVMVDTSEDGSPLIVYAYADASKRTLRRMGTLRHSENSVFVVAEYPETAWQRLKDILIDFEE